MPADSFNIPRHWWGKIIGGLIGLFRGSLTGAVLGALLGHFVDRFLAGIIGVGATQKAFFDALFSTLGHLAKADGRISRQEIEHTEKLFVQMGLSGEQRRRAIEVARRHEYAFVPDMLELALVADDPTQFRQELRRLLAPRRRALRLSLLAARQRRARIWQRDRAARCCPRARRGSRRLDRDELRSAQRILCPRD